jgi:hypothetical protein
VLCLGHTDRSGDGAYNKKLSDLRAKGLRALMAGERDEWVAVCGEKHVVRDYQLILKWVANVRAWSDCDPGRVDGDHGNGTSRALRAFKKRFNAAYAGALADNATIDDPTWAAFFRMYTVGLANLLQVDEAGLVKHRAALKWLPPSWVGCCENHPVTADTAANYRSRVDRRVELLFFDPGEEPRIGDCHPSASSCKPEQCELYRLPFLGGRMYKVRPLKIPPNAKVALRLAEVRGLYKPGHNDAADVFANVAKLAGYLKGYKSEDDNGRIFVNQVPRVEPSVSWEDVKKKNQQFIELSVTVDVAQGTLPPDAEVVWEWSDPDDPSDAGMRDDAAAIVDANDFDTGQRTGSNADDNQGHCDFPKPNAGPQPAFEQIGGFRLTPDAAGSKRCFTLISGGKSEVRFHCTDAGGDNFRIQATVRAAPGLVVTAGDRTGTMTMWKRIDVEHRRMKDAESIPAKDMAVFFEKQFVQMDVGPEEQTTSNDAYINKNRGDDLHAKFVDDEFKNKKKPGWFFVCVAREAAAPVGKPRHSLYEGPAKLVVGGPIPLVTPTRGAYFDERYLPQWESIVVDGVLTEQPLAVSFFEAGKTIAFMVSGLDANVPRGKSTIRLLPIDFQSDFEPADGSWNKAYAQRALYFPRYRYRWPEKVWERKGYGFPDDVYVNIVSRGAAITAGISPEVTDGAGVEYFAGRTVVFVRHPSFTKPAESDLKVEGSWAVGDDITVTVDGTAASYRVAASDVTVPVGAPDAALYVRGQVARGIEATINSHPVLSTKVSALAAFGKIRVRSAALGAAGNGATITATPAGRLTLTSPTLAGGGFDDEARREIVQVFTHELGHAFGFPHKCGYNTFESAPGTSCTMNYFHTWLYKLGSHLDSAAREVERFGPGKKGNDFCAHHTRGIRLGRLEDNPVIWSW